MSLKIKKCTEKRTWQEANDRSIKTRKNNMLSRIMEYNKSPNKCKYCSVECFNKNKRENTITKWLSNFIEIKRLTHPIRNYLIEQANSKCSICGWGEINQYSGNPALIIDHIDGNSENNAPGNLRVICPNCDSLLPTYKALNKGNGRAFRKLRYSEGKSY